MTAANAIGNELIFSNATTASSAPAIDPPVDSRASSAVPTAATATTAAHQSGSPVAGAVKNRPAYAASP